MLEIRKLYFILLFGIGSFLFLSAKQDDTSVVPIISEKELEKIFANIKEEDFSNFDSSEFSEILKNPAEMLERLPEDLRFDVESAWSLAGKVTGKIMQPMLMQDPMIIVFELLTNLKSDINNEGFINFINDLEIFFSSNEFSRAIKYGLFDIDLKEMLYNYIYNLDELISSISYLASNENIQILKDVLVSFKEDAVELFFDSLDRLAIKERLLAKKLLSKAYKSLNAFIKKNNDPGLMEAALFFRDEALEGLRPIMNAIDNKGTIDQLTISLLPFGTLGEYVSKFIKTYDKAAYINPTLLFGYGFYKKFLDYYVLDNYYSAKIFLADKIISSLFLPIYVLKKISDLKKMNDNNISAQEIAFAAGSLYNEIGDYYSDPNFFIRKSGFAKRAVYRLSTAIAYYNFWVRRQRHFNDIPQNIDAYNDKRNSNYKYWPKDFKHLKNSIWFTLKDGSNSFGNYLENSVYSKLGLDKILKIENTTLGLIKPELINFSLNTIMPIFTVKYFPKSIANFNKTDVLGKEHASFFDSKGRFYRYLLNPLSFTFGYAQDLDYIYYIGKRDMDKISYEQFIEGRILGYLSINLGSFIGKKVALKLKDQFGYLFGKIIVSLTEKMGIFNFEQNIKELEQNGYDFSDLNSSRKKFVVLKVFIKDMLGQMISLRSMDLGELPGDINPYQVAVNGLFSTLVNTGIFNKTELSDIEEQFIHGTINQGTIDNFAEKLLDGLQTSIAQKIGGFIGAFATWNIADTLIKKNIKNSTIYSKVKMKLA